jgi:hypothetical protein
VCVPVRPAVCTLCTCTSCVLLCPMCSVWCVSCVRAALMHACRACGLPLCLPLVRPVLGWCVCVCTLRFFGYNLCHRRHAVLESISFSSHNLFLAVYCCFLILAREREHTTCATLPGPRHRSNTTLSTSRLLASRPPARDTIKGPSSARSIWRGSLTWLCLYLVQYHRISKLWNASCSSIICATKGIRSVLCVSIFALHPCARA